MPNMWVNPGENGLDSNGASKRTNGIDDDGNGFIDDVHGANMYPEQFSQPTVPPWFCADEPPEGNPLDGWFFGGDFHGTRIAGTIGAVGNNGQGLAGAAWEVKIMNVRRNTVLPCGFPPGPHPLVRGVDYAINKGAHIINCSWGLLHGQDAGLDLLCQDALAKGIILVVAAGNAGENLNSATDRLFPQLYEYDNIIVVGATDRLGHYTSGSNWSTTLVDVAAPGVDIPSLPAFRQERGEPWPYDPIPPAGGTSFIAPHVAGVIALLKKREPTLSVQQIVARIRDTGPTHPSICPKTITGRRLDAYRVLANQPASSSCQP